MHTPNDVLNHKTLESILLENSIGDEKEYIEILYYVVKKNENDLLNQVTFDKNNLSKFRSKCISPTIKSYREFDQKRRCLVKINEVFAGYPGLWQNADSNRTEKICKIEDLFDPIEIKIWLLKELQSGEIPSDNNRDDIAEKLGMSKNTLNKYIKELTDGTDILDHEININLRWGNNSYDNTVHPIFLTLSLSEVYLLTAILKAKIGREADRVVCDIVSQLSNYGKQRLYKLADQNAYDLPTEDELANYTPMNDGESEKGRIIYYLKTGEPCRITNKSGEVYIGTVSSYDEGKLVFNKIDGKIIIEDDIKRIDHI